MQPEPEVDRSERLKTFAAFGTTVINPKGVFDDRAGSIVFINSGSFDTGTVSDRHHLIDAYSSERGVIDTKSHFLLHSASNRAVGEGADGKPDAIAVAYEMSGTLPRLVSGRTIRGIPRREKWDQERAE